jgi:hypothetical protein
MTVAERAYFLLCGTLGALLRAARYSKVRIVNDAGELQVRKRRAFYAPLLVSVGNVLLRILDAGVRVLPQAEWEERERQLYQRLYDRAIRIDADATIVLPCFAVPTLARVLEDPTVEESVRSRSIALAVAALVDFHGRGLTHGDAMAENVLVDLDAGLARWVDFETFHDTTRPMIWRCADDVRALAVTCLLRTAPERRGATLQLVLDLYGDGPVAGVLATFFTDVMRRPLAFHLGQAGLSFEDFGAIAGLLRQGAPWLREPKLSRR